MKKYLDKKLIQIVEHNEETLVAMINLIERDIADCERVEISIDRRYATAYGAALNIANYVIRKKGYRVAAKAGHHKTTFEVANLILGNSVDELFFYFDKCRRKRNKIDYDAANVVSQKEVEEIVALVKKFKELVFV